MDVAVAEITGQLAGEKLLRHSVGIVSCFADFVSSGVVAALAEKLPFPLVGTTTLAAAAPGFQGEIVLILTVFTSDDVEFTVAVTGVITEEDEAPLKAAWEAAAAGKPGKPSLMLSFAPLLLNIAADFYADTWSRITGNVPNFGTLAVDHNQDYHESQTILGKEAFRDRYVFVLFYGTVEPEFYVGGLSEEKAFREKGVVTSSQGNLLKEVNGVPVADYLTSLGLEKDEKGVLKGINSFPFILDYNDGTPPVIRAMYAITPDGSAVCGGKIPEGATLTVGIINTKEVLATSSILLQKAKEKAREEGKSILIFSCVGRYFIQGFNPAAEMDRAREILGDTPFHFCYSGTELSPVIGKDGKIANRCHNDTIIICVF
ncbi:MAG: FIST C-terminal domain-containing protein [Treponema sp.]|nr:FIST C-terminal domain-containing protein [Treponema sp.]